MKNFKLASLSILAIMLFLMPLVSQAGQKEFSDNIFISATEVINNNVFKTGNSVIIEGTINGDVYAAGNIVKITGPISGSIFVTGNNITISSEVVGSIFAAGNNINISGTVGGSIRSIGNNISIDATVKENVLGAGANLSLKDKSSVGWDVILAGATISTDGIINRGASLYGESITLGGNITGDVKAEVGSEGSLAILRDANISGNVNYKANNPDQIDISDQATILGEKTFSKVEKADKKSSEIEWQKFIFFLSIVKLIGLFGMIVVGLVIIKLSKSVIDKNISNMTENAMTSIGYGLVIFLLTPLLLILLTMTLIGIPLVLILLPIYFILIYLAKVMAAFVIGNKVLEMTIKKKNKLNLIWSLIIGSIILTIIISIPIIGWIAKLFIIWWGLGSLIIVKKELLKIINK